ncbi:MAG TPA: hypothetical protein VGI93_12450 [Steroidobacteraceae bacterium]|jgi:hypothetical protein
MKILMLLLAAPALSWGATAPSAEDMARCASIKANDARLACFDALAAASAQGATRPAPSAPIARQAPIAPAAPVPPSAPVAPVAPAAPQAPAAAAATAQAGANPTVFDVADPKNFGLIPGQRHFVEQGPKSEAARIISMATGQLGRSTLVLDNGQTWVVLDDDGWLSSGQEVKIKRATLGSFTMLAPSHHTYKVHRVQ